MKALFLGTLLAIILILNSTLILQSQPVPLTLILSWQDNSPDEDGFIIERRFGRTGTFSEVSRVGVDVVQTTDLTPDEQLYCYQVKAFITVADATPTEQVSTPSNIDCKKPKKPTGHKVKR